MSHYSKVACFAKPVYSVPEDTDAEQLLSSSCDLLERTAIDLDKLLADDTCVEKFEFEDATEREDISAVYCCFHFSIKSAQSEAQLRQACAPTNVLTSATPLTAFNAEMRGVSLQAYKLNEVSSTKTRFGIFGIQRIAPDHLCATSVSLTKAARLRAPIKVSSEWTTCLDQYKSTYDPKFVTETIVPLAPLVFV